MLMTGSTAVLDDIDVVLDEVKLGELLPEVEVVSGGIRTGVRVWDT